MLKNFGLLILAVALSVLLFPFGVAFTLVVAIRRGSLTKVEGYLSKSFYAFALAIDVLGNTVCRDFFNAFCIRSGGYGFGQKSESVSRVLGINKRMGTLTDAGRALANLLNWWDQDHVEKASNSHFNQ